MKRTLISVVVLVGVIVGLIYVLGQIEITLLEITINVVAAIIVIVASFLYAKGRAEIASLVLLVPIIIGAYRYIVLAQSGQYTMSIVNQILIDRLVMSVVIVLVVGVGIAAYRGLNRG